MTLVYTHYIVLNIAEKLLAGR